MASIEPLDASSLSSAPAMSPNAPKKAPPAKRKSNANKENKAGADATPDDPTPQPKKARKNGPSDGGEPKERGIYCHLCRAKCEPDDVLRCTRLKQFSSKGKPRACNLAFCSKDLKTRYGVAMRTVMQRGKKHKPKGDHSEHDDDKAYYFVCPCCEDRCENSICRKKGLEPVGNRSAGSSFGRVWDTYAERASIARGAPSAKVLGSQYAGIDFPTGKEKPSPVAKAHKEAAAAAAKGKHPQGAREPQRESVQLLAEWFALKQAERGNAAGPSTNGNVSSDLSGPGRFGVPLPDPADRDKLIKFVASKANPNMTLEEAEKEKNKERYRKRKEAKLMEQMREHLPAPEFERVDTRLGREEAEQRIYLREYVNRFRGALGMPARSLGPLDDFDRSLTEAAVRSIAGGMLEMIREDMQDDDEHSELVDTMQNQREELRYYADLARFGAIFNALSGPLELSLPSDQLRSFAAPTESKPMATSAVAADAPLRRAAASRVPQPAEVVRMLLALAERTLSTPRIKSELDAADDDRKKHWARAMTAENKRWVKQQKEMEATRKRQGGAGLMQQRWKEEKEHHLLEMSRCRVNGRIVLASLAPRYEPLGTDVHGRIYYLLTPRVIDDRAPRGPTGWASGVLVWGRGVEKPKVALPAPVKKVKKAATAAAPAEATTNNGDDSVDQLPPAVDRWTHFGTSDVVKQLERWVDNRYYLAIAAREKKDKKAATKKRGAATPKSGGATPKNKVATPAASRATPVSAKVTPGRGRVSVVIPPRKIGDYFSAIKQVQSPAVMPGQSSNHPTSARITAIPNDADDEDGSDSDSNFSDAPDDLLRIFRAKGYEPSVVQLEERRARLVGKLKDAAEWLSVLEGLGLGEV
ncbi:hypothetical protein Q5752_001299 [Cryptotrichosporon argae]